MLPGAVLGRLLLDLGARLIKVEDPQSGDPYRHAPPLDEASGVGAGFAFFLAGAESVALDLRGATGAAMLRRLARQADVLVESFRPGTMDGWGLGYERLSALNPSLVYLSLSSYGAQADPRRVGHDLNITAETGLLSLMGQAVPRIPISDIGGGLLAASALLAALFQRSRTRRGTFVDQPLRLSVLPFAAWFVADAAAGGGGLSETMLGGATPAYNVYTCADGKRVALGALEPKFWDGVLRLTGLSGLSGLALDHGPEGQRAIESVAAVLAREPAAFWVEKARAEGLPLTPVAESPAADLGEPFVPSLSSRPAGLRPPRLGEHTTSVLRE